MRLVAAGLSFRSAPLAVRETVALGEGQSRELLRYLVGHQGASGAAALSTCNRTELYAVCQDGAASDVAQRLAGFLDPNGEHDLSQHLSWRVDADATAHMFRVASGLESMVIGEAQVLGQFKAAHRFAREAGTLDAHLDFVMRRAISTAKLVHTHTTLSRGTGSLSDVAIRRASAMTGGLVSRGVLLVGAGKMSALAAVRLREAGARMFVMSRAESRERLARAHGAIALAIDELVDSAEAIDVIISSTDSSEAVLDAARVAAMQTRRGWRRLVIVDLALPRDVDPAAAAVAGVSLIDLDDLGRQLAEDIPGHREAIDAAEQIIGVELRHTMTVLGQRDAAGPTISALTRRAETLRQRELERTFARLPAVDAATRERVEVLTQSLVRKLLHDPIALLRESADDPSVALVLRQAFGLDDLEVNAGGVEVAAARAAGTDS